VRLSQREILTRLTDTVVVGVAPGVVWRTYSVFALNEIFPRAIQAGKEFPEAEVVAVDISPLPNR
jgi:hypothetical protein